VLTIKQALVSARELLNQRSTDKFGTVDNSVIDFEVNLMLAHVLGVNSTWLRTWPEHQLTEAQQHEFEQLCQRRVTGEPIAYLLGEWSFWSFKLKVTPDTLIPRPETEHLVEWVLQHFSVEQKLTIADLGTGSGAIALALAMERPQWRIIATDYSPAALAIAKANAAQLQINNIEWYCGSWFDALPPSIHCDVIVSNPPYIAPHDPHLSLDGLPFEPTSALVAHESGLADIKHLIQSANQHLMPHGWLVLEHGYEQGLTVRQLFVEQGFKAVATINDYSGRERITFGQNELYL
jgi:release factor glutamine methyltransferase